MSSIPTPLSAGLYSAAKGYAYGFLIDENGVKSKKGFRIGDMDSLELNVEVGEEPRYTNETGIKTRALDVVNELTATLTLTGVQASDLLRAAALMGNMSTQSQAEQLGVVMEFTEPGEYDLGGFGITSFSAVLATNEPAVVGRDYEVFPDAGIVEVKAPLELEFDIPEINTGFATGIAAGLGMRMMFRFTGTNRQGVRVRLQVEDVNLRPSGARSYIAESGLTTISLTGTCTPDLSQPEGFEIGYEARLN